MTPRNLVLLIAITVVLVVIDQASKLAVIRWLKTEGNSVELIHRFLSFVLTYNPHGVMGLRLGHGLVYFVFPLLGILLVVLFASSTQHFGFLVSYGLILGGAFGNFLDRVFRPAGVVDFISVRLAPLGIKWPIVNPWFTWNIADGCLVVGIILLLLLEILTPRRKPTPAPLSSGD